MNAIWTIALREARVQFLSPLAWSLLAVLFAIAAFMFNSAMVQYQMYEGQFRMTGQTQELPLTQMTVTPMLGNVGVLLLLLLPLFTMRLIAEEKRRDTWPALASSPLNHIQIILGKYFGFLLFLLVAVLLIGLLPFSLHFFANPDTGQILAGLLGLFLMGAAFGAVGLATSTVTDNPTVSAILGFGALILLWVMGWMGNASGTPVEKVLNYLSIVNHFENFLKGLVHTSDLAYFLLLAIAGLLFARHRLLAEQIQG